MASLLVLRTDSDIEPVDLQRAREALADDPRVRRAERGLAVGAFSIDLSASPGVWKDVDRESVSAEEAARRDADVRQHDYVCVTTLDSARNELRYAAGFVADALGASVYDPQADEWLSLSRHVLEQLAKTIDEQLDA